MMNQSRMSADAKTADTTATRKSRHKTDIATTQDMCDPENLKKKFHRIHRQTPASLWFTTHHTSPHHRWNRTRQCMTEPVKQPEDNHPRPACRTKPYGLDGL
mmetsp:Transcript_46695/g.109068  ORF Transcript_46695/g.109068 Transcript_46695/m.109068 type:complete len:102 (+) Transcript_46695:404-709(+)